eukprot:jgi/Mesen1/3486/ME000195S02635
MRSWNRPRTRRAWQSSCWSRQESQSRCRMRSGSGTSCSPTWTPSLKGCRSAPSSAYRK